MNVTLPLLSTPTLEQQTAAPEVIKFTILGRHFLGDHYYILSLSDLCLEVDKTFFK